MRLVYKLNVCSETVFAGGKIATREMSTTNKFSDADQVLIDECFAFAKNLVRQAGELVKEGFHKSIDAKNVTEKTAKFDMVTEYDERVERYLMNEIRTKYSDHK